jgi:hypothetical protein
MVFGRPVQRVLPLDLLEASSGPSGHEQEWVGWYFLPFVLALARGSALACMGQLECACTHMGRAKIALCLLHACFC